MLDDYLKAALDAIDPVPLDRETWVHLGQATKAGGGDVSDWIALSRRDPARFHPGECERLWNGFNKSGIGPGTIVWVVRQQRPDWRPELPKGEPMKWDDPISTDWTPDQAGGGGGPATGTTPTPPPSSPPEPEGKPNHPGLYAQTIEAAESAMDADAYRDYEERWGVNEETAKAFHVGREEGEDGPDYLLPYDGKYGDDRAYWARRMLNHDPDRKWPPKYTKPDVEEAGDAPLYNAGALYTGRPCYVVEGGQDCQIITQIGGEAVALIGTAAGPLLRQIAQRRPTAPLVLLLDNDPEGRKNQERLMEKLEAMGVVYKAATLDPTGYGVEEGDPCDLYLLDRDRFKSDVETIATEAAEMDMDPEAAKRRAQVDQLLMDAYGGKYCPTSIGIPSLDRLLHGGLIPQTVTVIGSPPGTGKTTLATWIGENFARARRPVVYVNLEMSTGQLIARALSRLLYVKTLEDGGEPSKVAAVDILQGYGLPEPEREGVEWAAEEYKSTVADFMAYNPTGAGPAVEDLENYLERQAKRYKENGGHGPTIVVDYLQLLTSKTGLDATEIAKRGMAALKTYAIDASAIVIVIVAQNREANKENAAPTMSGARDSSAIEYTADLFLTLKAVEDKVELRVAKSRFTQSNMREYLSYKLHGGQSYLEFLGACTSNDDKTPTATSGPMFQELPDDTPTPFDAEEEATYDQITLT